MNSLQFQIPLQIKLILAIIFSVLTLCLIVFYFLKEKKKTNFSKELFARTKSWFYIAIGVSVLITAPPIYGTLLVGFISFVALREMLSITTFRAADRNAMFFAYLAVPVQYYLAYHNYYAQFLSFIPLIMFTGLPIIMVMSGKTNRIGTSMSLLPSILILTVYMLSHIVLLFHLDIPHFEVGPGGLIIYLIMLTAFNDVFQFTWGKIFGNKKILPNISPNKTWEGFIGGVLTTALLGYLIRFLTPLDGQQGFLMGLVLGIMGFWGDSIISAIKRDLSLKDTDDLIPGHGGAMDRLDSILITTPVYYHLLCFFISQNGA